MPALLFLFYYSMGFAMQLRNILDFIFASPVTIVSSIVSVVCVGILVVNITSNGVSSSTVDDAPGGVNNHGALLHRNDVNPDNTHYENQTKAEQSGYLQPAYPSREYTSTQTGGRSKRDYINTGRRFVNSTNDGSSTDSPSAIINNRSSIFNYSNDGHLTGVNTTNSSAININTTGSNESSSSTVIDHVVISDADEDTGTENNFPSSLENTVKIDLDETQIISCRPVVANGPPCMCTFTTSDASGSVSEVVDNCS